MPADDLLDRADSLAKRLARYHPEPDGAVVRDMAAEVRRLRTDNDALRERCAMDDEGHRRVCGPAIEERDALRSVVRYWYDHAVKSFGKPDMREWEDEDWADSGWTPAEAAAIRAALVAPDPTSPTDTGTTT